MSTQTITEFLEARIAEDEAVAREATVGPWKVRECTPCTERGRLEVDIWDEAGNLLVTGWCDDDEFHRPDAEHIARHDPTRVLAECAAKRAIIAAAVNYSPELEHGDNGEWAFDVTLRALAAAYKDHADYQQEWAL